MQYNHVIVWVDHAHAQIIHFNPEHSEISVIKSHSTQPHLHVKSSSVGSGNAQENKRFFADIASDMESSLEILLVGPSNEKHELMRYLLKHDLALSKKIVGVEALDHPTDGQLLAYARHYFEKADLMRMDPIEALRCE
jgi:stalled ribosome rescue protein Dom34